MDQIDVLRIRIAVPLDVAALQAFVRNLSMHSRAARFFVPVAELPPMLVQAIEARDSRHHLLIAREDQGAESRVVALAQYAVTDEAARSCDIALVVADDRQRRGLGYRLILRLIEDARNAGLRYAEGEVLRHNRAMLALARRAGFEVRRHPGDATLVKIVLELQGNAAAEAATPTLLAAA